jgi:DNA-binding FadR family transcriptional regulator
MVEQGYYSGANEADLKFHETLMECSGNSKLIQTYNNNHIPLFHQQLIKNKGAGDDYELTDREHRAILKALKENNIALAEKNMRLHFARGATLLALQA